MVYQGCPSLEHNPGLWTVYILFAHYLVIVTWLSIHSHVYFEPLHWESHHITLRHVQYFVCQGLDVVTKFPSSLLWTDMPEE